MFFTEGLPVRPARMANTPGAVVAVGVFCDDGDLMGMSTVAGSFIIKTLRAGKSLIDGGTLDAPVDSLSIDKDEGGCE